MRILESAPIGLIGASIGVIVSGIVQLYIYKKQVIIDQQITAGTKLLEFTKNLHYSLSKVKAKHEELLEFRDETNLHYYIVDFAAESKECYEHITEIIMLRRLYAPVVSIKDEQVVKLFDAIDEYFSQMTEYANTNKKDKLNLLMESLNYIMISNNVLIYDIQDSMFKGISSKKKLKEKQNENIVTPMNYKEEQKF